MRTPRFPSVGFLIMLAVAGRLAAAQGTPAPTEGDPLKWLTQAQLDGLIATTPAPPALHSAEDQADLAAILEAQKARTP